MTGAKVKDGSLRPKDIKGLFGNGPAVPGPAGPPGSTGIGPAYQAYGEVNYDKLSSSPYASTAVTLPLPAGSYFATEAVAVETVNATGTHVQCRRIDGVGGSGSSGVVMRSQSVRADGTNDSFTLTGAFPVGSGEALNLQCSKGAAGAGARIADASIVAVQVTGISGQAQ